MSEKRHEVQELVLSGVSRQRETLRKIEEHANADRLEAAMVLFANLEDGAGKVANEVAEALGVTGDLAAVRSALNSEAPDGE
jgi:adenylosuccinate lyase